MKRLMLISFTMFFIPTHPQGQSTNICHDAGTIEEGIAENLSEIDTLKHVKNLRVAIYKYQLRNDSLLTILNNTMPSN